MDMTFSQNYVSPFIKHASFPSLCFYPNLVAIIYRAGRIAQRGVYDGARWVYDSVLVGKAIERVGTQIIIEGIEQLALQSPCVFEANHMSTLETMLLPSIIQPRKDVTFVIKRSLLNYPCLGPVLSARDPIALGRENPREDLRLVLEKGCEILAGGRSIIIFTQGSRKKTVEERDFNTLGVKLAKKAGVPIMPIALKTDAWGEGSLIKDFGWIRPDLPVHVRFGEPISVNGNGKEEHAGIVHFIKSTYDAWVKSDGQA